MIERLDPRRLFAGTIRIDTRGDQIVFRGDAAANHLTVDSNPAPDESGSIGYIIYSSFADRTILFLDGVRQPADGIVVQDRGDKQNLVFERKPWRVDLAGGDDTFEITGFAEVESVTADLGDGNDYYRQQGVVGSLTVMAGAGDDAVSVSFGDYETAANNATFDMGPGRDKVSLMPELPNDPYSRFDGPILIAGRLRILDTSGPSRVYLRDVRVSRQTQIVTGNSRDRVTLALCSFKGPFTVATHGGGDVLAGTDNVFHGGGDVESGSGHDRVDGLDDLLD